MIEVFAAFIARVREVAALDDTAVFDGRPLGVNLPPMYLCVFDMTPTYRDARLDASRGSGVHTFSVQHVGTDPDEVRFLVGQTTGLLIRHRLVVAGRTSTPLQKIAGQNITPDDPMAPQFYVATDVWRCALNI